MQVDLGSAIAVGTLIFAAGGGWVVLHTTATRGKLQGERIGELEQRVATLEGRMRVGRKMTRQGVPMAVPDESENPP